ncbi:hypothetical protein C8Q77DRAFT_1220222 [Trametes polyzona]|nr:hypothetical protein C8Q77DRAFT_1220222 [Trametes polyzona]
MHPPSDPPPSPQPSLPSRLTQSSDNWGPFTNRVAFETADLLYRKEQMSAGNINTLLELWQASMRDGDTAPFKDSVHLYRSIDSIPLGSIGWQSFNAHFPGHDPMLGSVSDDEDSAEPSWMRATFEVWFRDVREIAKAILRSAEFTAAIDYGPYRILQDGEREYGDLMSADWAWRQADIISKYDNSEGAAFVPIILGSDKTTVSIATGQNEYYPLYASIGNITNVARRAHGGGVVLAGFLAIPKTRKKHENDAGFRKFRRQLFHASLSRILQSLKEHMTSPEVVLCGDGYHRKIVYGLGPYIADYPEQTLLTCVVQGWCPVCTANKLDLDRAPSELRSQEQTELLVSTLQLGEVWDIYGIVGDVIPFTNDFPRADIHELIAPDILHQLIKGTFKDHLVEWVGDYLVAQHGKALAVSIITDIDRRIAVVPPFSGLRRFPEGRGFKQWTGNDSKALMKVYIPAIQGHLPRQVVVAVRSFLDACYIVRRRTHTPRTVASYASSLRHFHENREVFRTPGVRPEGFSLPRQHSLMHYEDRIYDFGAPIGLCSSITESKHITAVKEPWRRSSRFNALGQMLLTNQRLDKLTACRTDFEARRMLDAHSPMGLAPELSCRGETKSPRRVGALGSYLACPELPKLLGRFLASQLQVSPPHIADRERIRVFPSARADFYDPCDARSDMEGRRHERIRATRKWRGTAPRYDCVFVNREPSLVGLRGMEVARVRVFFDFKYKAASYPCALVHWFQRMGEAPDEETGMWMARPLYHDDGAQFRSVIHLDTIVRAAHLVGVAAQRYILDDEFEYTSLDRFDVFYVNKYVDYHAFDLLHEWSV